MEAVLNALLTVLAAAYGMHLLYTGWALGWDGLAPGPRPATGHRTSTGRARRWLREAGLADLAVRDVAVASAALAAAAALGAFVLFGGALPAVAAGLFAAGFPLAAYRHRRAARLAAAQEAWPRLIDQMRVLTGSVGRSIPQALFEAGERAPTELQPAFAAAHREWLLSTDFARTLHVLKLQLADPTADAVAETLLVAHDLGGTDLDRRLADLAADRRRELQFRKDARARQAGIRFARSFVLLVPLGMAAAGLAIGDGRAAYRTPAGQVLVCVALGMVMACWWWAGRILRLPEPERVFDR